MGRLLVAHGYSTGCEVWIQSADVVGTIDDIDDFVRTQTIIVQDTHLSQ